MVLCQRRIRTEKTVVREKGNEDPRGMLSLVFVHSSEEQGSVQRRDLRGAPGDRLERYSWMRAGNPDLL